MEKDHCVREKEREGKNSYRRATRKDIENTRYLRECECMRLQKLQSSYRKADKKNNRNNADNDNNIIPLLK